MTAGKAISPRGAIFLGSKGGAGHNSAREALLKRYLNEKGLTYSEYEQHHRDNIKVLDMLEDILDVVKLPFVGKAGQFGIRMWNTAQQSGNVRHQEWVASAQYLGEMVMFPVVYRYIKKMLNSFDSEPELFVSTQGFCTPAIVKAIHAVNQARGWSLKLDVWMTDMPTPYAKHFFYPLKKTKVSGEIVCLHTVKPILEANHTAAAFWKRHIGSVPVIHEEQFPIRHAFLKQESLLNQEVRLMLKTHDDLGVTEHQAIDGRGIIFSGLSVETKEEVQGSENELKFLIRKQDRVSVLLLGSQPSRKAALTYLNTIKQITKAKEKSYRAAYKKYCSDLELYQQDIASHLKPVPPPRIFFFLYAGAPETIKAGSLQKNVLLREISENLQDLPENLNVVAFTYQNDTELAPLMARADLTITRSGGLTSMELLHLNNKERRTTLIHTEDGDATQKKTFTTRRRGMLHKILQRVGWARTKNHNEKGGDVFANEYEQYLSDYYFIGWEGGNATYLIKEIEAKIVQPSSCLLIVQRALDNY